MSIIHTTVAESREQYDALVARVGRPAGLQARFASTMPDGRVQIVSVWESQQASDAFAREVLRPVLVRAGVPEAAIEDAVGYEVFESVR